MRINISKKAWDNLSEEEQKRIIRRKVLKRIGWGLLPLGFVLGLIFCAYVNETIGILLATGTMITGIILVFWNLGKGIGSALVGLGKLAEKNFKKKSETGPKKNQSQKPPKAEEKSSM